MKMENPLIVEVSALGKRIGDGDSSLVILHDVTFSVMAGETVAIVGASGSGKSTLLGLLAGLDLPSTGTVRIDGTDLSTLDEDGRAVVRGNSIGFVFQSFQLLPALSAQENVALPLELAGHPDAMRVAEIWLQRVGLGSRKRHLPRELSGGEQQRVALARAFCTEPRLVLADEPTGNLDPTTGDQIIDLMFSLNAESSTTLLLVTHDEEVAARCSRRLRMSEGRLVEQESRSSPLRPGDARNSELV